MASTRSEYRVGWLIDGTGQPAVNKRMVIVDGGRIKRIGDADAPLPADVAIIGLSDYTVFPALIDSHVRCWQSGSASRTISKRRTCAIRCGGF